MQLAKCLALAMILLLGGCLEAVDLAEEQLGGPAYCATPNGIVICPDND
jgi:hypothetical protein